jgi:hypothetical protein
MLSKLGENMNKILTLIFIGLILLSSISFAHRESVSLKR